MRITVNHSLMEGLIMSNLSIDKVIFREYKSELLGVLFITCTFYQYTDEGKLNKFPIARGISICSLADSFNRKKGKTYAYGRADKALKRKANCGYLGDTIPVRKVRRTYNGDFTPDLRMNYSCDVTKVRKNDKGLLEFTVNQFYPLQVVRSITNHKAEFMPREINLDTCSYPIEEVVR